MNQIRRLLSERETAAVLNVSPSSLQKRRERGLPPTFVRIGRRVGYDPDDLASFINASKVPSSHDDGLQGCTT